MKSSVLKCIGLGLGLQGLLWGDFCEVCRLEHKPGQCPVETLKLHLEEFDVDDWDSDVEEAFVQEYELVAQRLRKVRKWHHYQSLQKKVAKLDWEPLDIALINAALLEKSDCLLNEIKSMDLALLKQRESDVAELDMDMVREVELLLEEENERLEAEQKRQAELRRQQEEEDRKRREEEQRLERERKEQAELRRQQEEVERIRKAEEERRRLEEEARRPRGVYGQQIFDYIERTGTPKKKNCAANARNRNVIVPATLYTDPNQLPPKYRQYFSIIMSEQN